MAKMTFEAAMTRLEDIADALEDGSQTLENSLKLFEESTELMSFCLQKLDEAEKKIQLLNKTADGYKLNETDLD